MIIQARLKHMCFKLLRSTSCALIQLGNLLQDLHCVIPHLSDTLTPPPQFQLALTFLWQPSLFSCVRHFPRPLIPFFTFNTLQANHNAVSDYTGQSQCRFYQNTTILQVGVKPGQLVAVHQVLGVAEVWQWISVVTQVGQGISMVVSTFHHGV